MKYLINILVGLLCVPFNSFAGDYFEVKYDDDKPSSCTAWFYYRDGDNKKLTCNATDKSARSAGDKFRLYCPSGGKIRHLEHRQSSVFAKSNCTLDLTEVRAVNTKGKGKKSKGTILFNAKDDEAKDRGSNKTSTVNCYRRMALHGDRIQIFLNSKHTSNSSCKDTVVP
jgi:hypothetical protein